jgi:PTS system ascorbate-specific IIB component
MSKALKILVVCGNGLGSSLIVKMSLEAILADLNIYGIVEGTSVSQASGMMYSTDLVITSTSFFKGIESVIPKDMPVITCKNIFDRIELAEKVKAFAKKWNKA